MRLQLRWSACAVAIGGFGVTSGEALTGVVTTFCDEALGFRVRFEAMPAEERKLVTVLFADLVGSTALASDEDPERTRMLLDRFYDLMEAEIERAGGTIEKFVGDAVMAAFGAPAAHEDDAERALHVALAMQRRLVETLRRSPGLAGRREHRRCCRRPAERGKFLRHR